MRVNTPEPTMIDGKPALNIGESAEYLGIKRTAFTLMLKHKYPEIKKHRQGFGQEKYILIEDLDKIKAFRLTE